MATAQRGDPGQAGTYDPKTGGKFEPGTKDNPSGPHHDHDDDSRGGGGPGRPQPK